MRVGEEFVMGIHDLFEFLFVATGGTPYPGMHTNEVYQLLLNGKRMDPPMYCPEEM
jgi:hypothetical protein